MELVAALPAPQARQLVVRAVDHQVADGARLDPRELAVDVRAPRREARRDGAVLVPQNRANRKTPLARARFGDARARSRRELGGDERVRFREFYK